MYPQGFLDELVVRRVRRIWYGCSLGAGSGVSACGDGNKTSSSAARARQPPCASRISLRLAFPSTLSLKLPRRMSYNLPRFNPPSSHRYTRPANRVATRSPQLSSLCNASPVDSVIMPRWSSSRKETAEDVREEFDQRIEHFLNHYEPVHNIFRSNRTLKDLTKWAKGVWDEKTRAEATCSDLNRKLKKSQDDLQATNKNLNETAKALHEEQRLRMGREQQLGSINDHWMGILNDTQATHKTELDEREAVHEENVRSIISKHRAEVASLNMRITKLTQDIMVNQADSRAWTDEKLKMKYNEVRRAIDDITSPHSLIIHERGNVRSIIDPNGFLDRQSNSHHFVLRGFIWGVLCEQFFSSPLGFGALGPGQGREALLRTYSAWRTLFDGTGDSCKWSFSGLIQYLNPPAYN